MTTTPSGALGSRENPMARVGGRLLLIDARDRVLLVRGGDPESGTRYWYTIGGGLEPGEDPAEGTARELYEETGLRVNAAELGEPLFDEVTEYPYQGVWYRQEQAFFALRVASYEVPTECLDPADDIHEYRWWSVDEIVATPEDVYPRDLAAIVQGILGS